MFSWIQNGVIGVKNGLIMNGACQIEGSYNLWWKSNRVSRLLVDLLLISYLKLMNHDINIVITLHFLTEQYLLKKLLRKDKHMQKLLRKAFR